MSTSISLRPYQEQAVEGVLRELGQHRATLLVAATGTGKTTIFSEIARLWLEQGRGRVLILAHREELITQAARRVATQTGLKVGIEMAEQRIDPLFPPDVVVGTVQTLSKERRRSTLAPDFFGLVIVDEAHHAVADTYGSVIDYFAGAKVLGVTATPDRGDGAAMRQVFESVAYVYEIRDAIEQGYLCQIRQKAVRIEGLDLSSVRTVAGDLNEGDLEGVMLDDENIQAVASATLEEAGGRPTMLFGVTVAHAHALAAALNRYQPGCARALDGKSDRDLRRDTLAAFSRGEFQVLSNCALFTEGFDEPSIACVAVARPTKSRAFYCLDAETEALTPLGWRRGVDLEVDDLIAAWNPETEEVRWEHVLQHIRRPIAAEETMLALQSDAVDLRVTDTHRMVWRRREGREHRPGPWQISRAGELAQRLDDWQLPCAGMQTAPGVPITDNELRFIAWVQTDGVVNHHTGAVQISQSTGAPDRCQELERVFDACDFKWRFSDDDKPTNFGPRTHPQRVYRISRGDPRVEDKHLTGWGRLAPWLPKADALAWSRLGDMDARQWSVFLEAWHLGDGSKQVNDEWTRRGYHLAVGDKRVADWLQSMCVRRGWRCNVVRSGAVWMVHTREVAQRSIGGASDPGRPRLQQCAYQRDEEVWCVSVPSGALLVRRNGKACVVGNTQMVGRGTRLHPSKRDLLILDFQGNAGRHTLVSPLDILDGNKDAQAKALAAKKMAADPELSILDALDEASREIAERVRAETLAKARYSAVSIDPFAMVTTFLDIAPRAGRWGGQPPAQEDLDYLAERAKGLSVAGMDGGQVAEIVKAIRSRYRDKLSSWNQARVLIRAGLDPEVDFATASATIDVLANNRWKPTEAVRAAYDLLAQRKTAEKSGEMDKARRLHKLEREAFASMRSPRAA